MYRVRGIDRPVLRGLTFTIEKGESYGLVGESGCGKTTAAFAVMRYLARNGRVVSGSIRADGADLLGMGEADVRRLRTSTLSMVYQDPGAALNPSIRIGNADRRGLPACGRRQGRGLRPGSRDAADGADLRSRRGDAPLPAPALRRHAAAGRDRDGARVGPDAPDPRRADDGPGRDRRGRGARPRRRAAQGVRDERALHQPQPRRDQEDVRARRRPLRRAARRGGQRRDGLRRPAPPLHGRPPSLHSPGRPPQGPRPAGHDPRLSPAAGRRAARMRLRRPLRPGERDLPHGRAGLPPDRRWALQPLSLPRQGGGAPARDERRAGRGFPKLRTTCPS